MPKSQFKVLKKTFGCFHFSKNVHYEKICSIQFFISLNFDNLCSVQCLKITQNRQKMEPKLKFSNTVTSGIITKTCVYFPGKLQVPSRSCWTLSMKCLLTSQALQANRLWIRRNANSSSTQSGFPIP